MDIFKDVLPSINQKTGNLLDNPENKESDYNAFLVNKAFSNGDDTILFANEMNKLNNLFKKAQYDFYYYGLVKGKRFNKWSKADADTINTIELIKEYYNCSFKKAKEYMGILNENQLEYIKERLFKGGKS